ncbi:MAG: inorganic phosphate transporter [Bacteroidales bacterium]|nr:inorganic phosphate transporter [Bacteroidales bacterium]
MDITYVYIAIVGILFLLAISDLVVGVSNDAVNFLNSAIGSKAAPLFVIIIIAGLGILIGTTFSSGMMEVARKGIFHPEKFNFSEIMVIFLAVMMTDILLLDFFNTLGLPTSTTVSIVFELLGAAVAVAILKVKALHLPMTEVSSFINSAKALEIIGGILLSIIISFTVGAIVQYFARVLFSFNLSKSYKYFGAIWGGIAISAITYFMLIKGAKGSSFLSDNNINWIMEHSAEILIFSSVGFTILLQILHWIFRINIFKVIVLLGTFGLAMAFAGNDLVNFIGVPLAGFQSFKDFQASGITDPGQFSMESLAAKVQTPTAFLLIAGIIMVITLWLSKKARSVTKTEVNLGRQDEGSERFGSTLMARTVVRVIVGFSDAVSSITPAPVKKWINTRFDRKPYKKQKKKEGVSFDLVRASVNLVVASVLIAIATSRKLPLSTTYVTFMVAMGSSLSDRAWNRDSAVFRVTGVFTVIGGWFITAFVAFTIAALIAIFISWASVWGIGILILLSIFLLTRTHILHRKRAKAEEEEEAVQDETAGMTAIQRCQFNLNNSIDIITDNYTSTISGLLKEKRKKLKKCHQSTRELNKQIKGYKKDVYGTIKQLEGEMVDTGAYYVQVVDSLKETVESLLHITKPVFDYVDNKHQPLLDHQVKELTKLNEMMKGLFNIGKEIITLKNFKKLDRLRENRKEITSYIKILKKHQIKLLQEEKISTRNTILYLELLNETKILANHIENVFENQQEFETFEAR